MGPSSERRAPSSCPAWALKSQQVESPPSDNNDEESHEEISVHNHDEQEPTEVLQKAKRLKKNQNRAGRNKKGSKRCLNKELDTATKWKRLCRPHEDTEDEDDL